MEDPPAQDPPPPWFLACGKHLTIDVSRQGTECEECARRRL